MADKDKEQQGQAAGGSAAQAEAGAGQQWESPDEQLAAAIRESARTIIYVAFRYQCQQDLVTINRLEAELKDAKYKALSSSSTLTERCRESHILEILKNNADSLLHPAEQPPYIITVPDEEE